MDPPNDHIHALGIRLCFVIVDQNIVNNSHDHLVANERGDNFILPIIILFFGRVKKQYLSMKYIPVGWWNSYDDSRFVLFVHELSTSSRRPFEFDESSVILCMYLGIYTIQNCVNFIFSKE